MTRYTVRAPDGKTLVIEGPAGASEADVMAQAQQLYKPALRTKTAPAPAPTPAQLAAHDAQAMAKRVYGPTQAIANGATLGASDWLNAGLDAGITGLQNLATRAQGGHPKYGMADRFNADRQAFVDQAAAHPVTNGVGGLLGGAFIPGLGKGLESANGLVQGIKNPITRSLAAAGMGAATGAPIGAVNGALTAAPGQEGQGAVNGATAGAVMGGAAPALSYGAGQAVKGAAVVAKTLARAANKAAGGQLLDPMRVAAQRLAESMKAEKVDPDTARKIMNQWLTSGVDPAMLDLLPRGGRTARMIRGAAMNGDASEIAARYHDKVAADTQANALSLTRRLTPDNVQTAAQHQAELEATRSAQADREYPLSYPAKVSTDAIAPALTGDAFNDALRGASKAANANKLNPAIADRIPELQALKAVPEPDLPSPADAPQPIDYIVQALRKGNTPKMEGPNLLQFIRKNGGIQPNGELSAMDTQSYHAGANGRGSLTQANGLTPDRMAQLAYDHGYIGNSTEADGQPGVQDLYDAIRSGLAGDHAYPNTQANAQAGDFARQVQNASDQLGQMGIDTAGMSHADLKMALTNPDAFATAMERPVDIGSAAPAANTSAVPPMLSVGTLDRLKINFRKLADNALAQNPPDAELAMGYRAHEKAIDDHLAALSPEYAMARDNYAANSRPIDAVQLGQTGLLPRTNPIDYADQLAGLGDGALPSAQIGLRSELEQRIGAPTGNATGILNTVSTGTNPSQILASTFGPEAAHSYQAGITNVVRKLTNARKIDQSTGSDSAGRLVDFAEQSKIPKKFSLDPLHIASNLWEKLQSDATLTDGEKAALLHLSTSPAQSVIPQISNVTSTPAQIDNWLTQHLATVAPQGGLLGSVALSNQSSQ